MTDQNWQNIKGIFLAAIELGSSARTDYLDRVCNGDGMTRTEVESLLASHFAGEDFIETPAFQVSEAFESSPAAAEQKFGHYSIIREIGVGGMGAVFLARRSDGEFDQLVAIKIVRQIIADSHLIDRFKRERQILAPLNHPNIARLLDGGVSEDGRPFLAMEYIEGDTLTYYAEHHNLNLNSRIELFLKVCSAVAYAHRNLIVHRDLKPNNIMVTVDGSPKLLDFGLAKLLDESVNSDSEQTQTAFRALTPAYASPEQIRGDTITTASDVYSLGIILYELLTGERPFHTEGKTIDEILHTVSSSEPTMPSQVGASGEKLKGDLDNIVLTALRPEPERRYKSVEQFADDLDRSLKGLPVSARPNTFKYLTEKFVKRHRYGVAAAMLIFGLVVIGLVGIFSEFRRAEMQRTRAEKRFSEVRKLSNSLMFEIHDSVQNLQGSTPTRQLIVTRAVEYLDSLAQESDDDASLRIELATAYQKIGDIQGNPYSANLGDTTGALKSYQKSVSILENLHGSRTTESEISLGKAYRALGDIFEVQGNVAECVNNYRRSLDIFAGLATNSPDRAEISDEFARANETLGDGLSRVENGNAEKLYNYQKNISIRQALVERNPETLKFKRSLAIAYTKLGSAIDAVQPEAAENVKKGILVLEELSKGDPMNARARREVGFAYYQLGNVLTEAGNFAEAMESRQRAFQIRREMAVNDPQNKQAQFDFATAYADLSEAFTNLNDTAKALIYAEQSQEIFEKLSQDDESNAIFRRNVGMSYEKSAVAYAHAAQNGKLSTSERIKHWKESSNWFKKTRQVFTDLRNLNELQPRDSAQIDKYSEKIIICEKSINELGLKAK